MKKIIICNANDNATNNNNKNNNNIASLCLEISYMLYLYASLFVVVVAGNPSTCKPVVKIFLVSQIIIHSELS